MTISVDAMLRHSSDLSQELAVGGWWIPVALVPLGILSYWAGSLGFLIVSAVRAAVNPPTASTFCRLKRLGASRFVHPDGEPSGINTDG